MPHPNGEGGLSERPASLSSAKRSGSRSEEESRVERKKRRAFQAKALNMLVELEVYACG